MRHPMHLAVDMVWHQLKNALRGAEAVIRSS